MKDISDKNFGPLIGFCLPGFILLYALSFSFSEVSDWLATSAAKDIRPVLIGSILSA
jgi:hypothetical protein